MKRPQRLLAGDLTSNERRALNAGLSLAAPAANKQRIWANLSAGLAASATAAAAEAVTGGSAALTGASQGATSAASALASAAPLAAQAAPLGSILVKTLLTWTLIGSALGVGAKLVLHDFPRSDSTPGAQAPAAVPTHAAPAGGALEPTRRIEDGTNQSVELTNRSGTAGSRLNPVPPAQSNPAGIAAGSRESRSASPKPSPALTGSQDAGQSLALERESRLLAQARTQLRSGQPQACLDLLGQAAAAFPKGWLQQERRALSIEARATLGQHAEVRRLAQDFVSDYPESPYAAKVIELVRE